MGYKRAKFEAKGFDEEVYKKHLHKNQAEYIRQKLYSVKLYAEGKEFKAISEELNLHEQSVRKYIAIYINGGFVELCKKTKHKEHKASLTKEQALAFKEILLTKRPNEVGLEGNIWTGEIMRVYLKLTYGVEYKSGIYDLLERLNLTHQKSHLDYGNAEPEKQAAFIEELKEALLQADETSAVLKFDEFSVSTRPTSYYGWAEKNTRPKVITNEKKKNE